MEFNNIFKKIIATMIIIACMSFAIGTLFFINRDFVAWLLLTLGVGVCLFAIWLVVVEVILKKIWEIDFYFLTKE